MSYKVLYRKYRPSDFENVVGQEYTVSMLKNAIDSKKNAHAYIFTGPRGTGKTSSAKIFAKALNCENPINGNPCNNCNSCLNFKENPDVIEIDAASNNGVDEIRELINNVKLVPSNSKYKVYIIDEVHMLTASAFNALLLTLEEPPSHVVFILATTDIQDVPITILSRCQRFDFKPIDKVSIVNRLKMICSEESISISDDALNEIALLSSGGMRDALGMLDQLSNDDKEITVEDVSNYFGSVSIKKINELLTAIEANDSENLVNLLNSIKDSGTNYSVFVEKLIMELRKAAIGVKTGKSTYKFRFDMIYDMIFDLNECLCNININIDPYVLIEIALLKYINYNPGNNPFNTFNQPNNSDSSVIENNVVEKNKVINKPARKKKEKQEISFDVYTRINNCFVSASKEIKNEVLSSWVDFMNFLMSKDRNLISLLADTSILAASNDIILIQSKIDSTNDLINVSIKSLENYYYDFSEKKCKFAAITNKIWEKEVEKYRFNLKNKIKYTYIEEEESSVDLQQDIAKESNIEEVAKDIFGTFEVE